MKEEAAFQLLQRSQEKRLNFEKVVELIFVTSNMLNKGGSQNLPKH